MFRKTASKLFSATTKRAFSQSLSKPNTNLLLLASVTLASSALYLYVRQEQDSFADEKKRSFVNVQDTVITEVHPHCAVVTIHFDNNSLGKQQIQDLLKAAAQVQGIADVLNKANPLETPDDEQPIANKAVYAGVGFDTIFFNEKISKLDGNVQYESRKGPIGDMPYTGGQLILHVKALNASLCQQTIEQFVKLLPGSFKVEDYYGFQYRDGRDLSGFLDGTMNVTGYEDRYDAAVQDKNQGSYLLHQRWVHNLNQWEKQSVATQEAAVGRKKDWSAELNPLPAKSHVERCRDSKGNRILVVRQSMPFGSFQTGRGLLFLAYTSDVNKINTMLDRMVGKGDGKADAIMNMSTCVSGNFYYFPGKQQLQNLAK